MPFYREHAENKINSLNLPQALQSAIHNKIRLMQLAYKDAFDWYQFYKDIISVFEHWKFSFANNAEYCCTVFFTLEGEFDDLKWVKKFVRDSQFKQFSLDQFHFACFYCLELDIHMLWNKISHSQLFKTNFVNWWIYQTVKETDEFIEDDTNFCLEGFEMVIRTPFKRAVDYFWKYLTSQEKSSILNELINLNRFSHMCFDPYLSKTVHLLFSHLTPQQQLHVLQNDMQRNRDIPEVWKCYLNSTLFQLIPEQITLHQDSLAPVAYAMVLSILSEYIRKRINPLYQEVFRKVWNLGTSSRKEYVFQNVACLKNLLSTKEFICSKLILRDSSLDEKRNFLFSNSENEIFLTFVSEKDWASIEEHLQLFVRDLRQPNPKIFHAGSLALLKEFEEDSWFAEWITEIPIKDAMHLLTIMKNISQEIETSTDILNNYLPNKGTLAFLEDKQPL